MRLSHLFLIATPFICGVQCALLPRSHVVHEKRGIPSRKWVKRDRVQPTAILPIRIGLSQSNLEKGHDLLMQVSDPASSQYGKHWTAEEVDEFFRPSDDAVAAVLDWLTTSGIDGHRITHSENKGWLAFDATTQESEALFLAEFHEYEHTETGDVTAACDEYHLPKDIQKHVDYVTPGIRLIAMKKRNLQRRGFGLKPSGNGTGSEAPNPPKFFPLPSTSSSAATPPANGAAVDPYAYCNKYITPQCIQALYQIPAGTKSKSSNKMGIFESGDAYAQEDLDSFFQNIYPQIKKGTSPKLEAIDGGIAPVALVNAGIESDLDFQIAYPIIWPQETVLYQVGLSATFNSFLDALDGSYCTYSAYGETGDDFNLGDPVYPDITYGGKLMCGKFTPTNVISISYGGDEWDIPAYYQQRQCDEFMKLGLSGHTVVIASGDDGVSGTFGCIAGTIFSPGWPATCPYVTTVGMTRIQPGKKVTDSEAAVSEDFSSIYGVFATGGGFSNVFPVPDYQKSALKWYFDHHKPRYPSYSAFGTAYNPGNVGANGGLYNRIGRGIPDVSANGENITLYNQGVLGLAAGTSASTPLFGAIINRINEERLAVGKSTVGFVNPVLYAHPEVLNDITRGNNPGCFTNGFDAVTAWDPATGLGTPNYPKMLKLWLGLP